MKDQALWLHEQRAILNMLREAGIDLFKTKMHFKLNKLRKEIRMEKNPVREKLRSYIKVLRAVQNDIEAEQDRVMSPMITVSMSMSAKDSEFITLGVVIRDLTNIAYDPEFSYWDKHDC